MNMLSLAATVNHLSVSTERLILRKMNFDDLEVALAHERDPVLMRYVKDNDDAELILKQLLKYLGEWHGFEGEWLVIAIELAATNQVIGTVACQFESIAFRRIEIGYRIHPDFQHQGFAFEAVQRFIDFLWHVKVHKIVAYCVTENQRSFQLMEKLAMRREGHLLKNIKLAGQWHDEYIYGLLKPKQS